MNQKNKNSVLVIGLVIVALIAYFFGIAKTIELSKQLLVLEKQKKRYQSAPRQLALLANKEQKLDKVLKENNLTGLSLQNNLLEVLNKASILKNFKITSFNEPHQYIDNISKSTISTYKFQLSGSYNTLVQMIYELEQSYSFGNIVHLNFEVIQNYRSRNQILYCEIFLQRIH